VSLVFFAAHVSIDHLPLDFCQQAIPEASGEAGFEIQITDQGPICRQAGWQSLLES
jgi:hypothetical protein